MTRPSIIRADTIDLQDHQAPSTTQLHPKGRDLELSLDDPRNHIAPHQAETLREVALESAEENLRSPRLVADSDGQAFTNQHSSNSTNLNGHSHNNSAYSNPAMDAYRQQEQETLAAHDAGGSSSDEDPVDGDDAELDDDDLMDKISSSPSIEDDKSMESVSSLHPEEEPAECSIEVYDEDDSTPNHDEQLPSDLSSSDESLQDSEDIDFEFVYALHTFVATVEGQANATKGDTMVLLDDSNSYWWLVRVVKDSSIGYLPAEHIETPTERLARLNKHRNIDLSATMLGDQAPKQKPGFNLLRKKKTVIFTDPTYVDYSDFDYSTDEEDIEELFGAPGPAQQQQQRQLEEDESTEKDAEQTATEGGSLANSAQVEPLRSAKEPTITAVSNDTSDMDGAAKDEPGESQQPVATADGQNPTGEQDDEVLEDTVDGPSRSKNGTVRNTDSFFKDSSETKKITLTPNLLRDDSAASPPSESTVEARVANSFDKMDREMASEKDKRKSKDKKPSAIRNFFSRKDKKRTSEDDDESFGKRSMDIMSDPRDSEELSEQVLSPDRSPHGTRQPTKLQKPQPRAEPSASRKVSVGPSQRATVELSSYLSEGRTNDVSSVPPASMRFTDPDTNESHEFASNDTQFTSPESSGRDRSGSASKSASALSKIVPKRSPSGSEIKPQKTIKAKTRLDLESSDSEIEAEARDEASRSLEPVTEGTTENVSSSSSNGGLAAAGAAGAAGVMAARAGVAALSSDKTSASGPSQGETIQASPSTGSIPPALVADTSSAEGRSPEASPSPEMSQPKDGSTTSSAREQWNDLKLKAFFEQNDHVHDLLAIVYDKTDNEQIGLDHPVAGSMFREQNAKLAEITTQLDNLLGDWLARKQRMRGTM